MDNIEIERYARRNKWIKKHFLGCFSPQQLPKQKISKSPFILITNYCGGVGCHWNCIFGKRRERRGLRGEREDIEEGLLEYFCTSGTPSYLLQPDINAFLKRQKLKITHSKVKIQHKNSKLCGKFCLLYAALRCKGVSLKKILSLFKRRNLKKNDVIVNKMFNKVFKK